MHRPSGEGKIESIALMQAKSNMCDLLISKENVQD